MKSSGSKVGNPIVGTLFCFAVLLVTIPRGAAADEADRFFLMLSNKPEIVVEQPSGRNLVDGKAKRGFGTVELGKESKSKTITVRNIGSAPLRGLFVTKAGANPDDFVIGPMATSKLKSGETTIFKIVFKPLAKGTRNAVIRIHSNDGNENPFDIKVTGTGS